MSPPLLDHLHASFLSGRAADVTVRVLHPWRAEYRLHRVVLLQAGFFEMLFEGGYREAEEGGVGKAVELRFGDPNITRAAFELCLAHLYRPMQIPSLPSSYIPTPSHPLTSSFPQPPSPPSPIPRLLLSLLATSSYLAIYTLMTEAARLILGSVGPWTVSRYLGFAVGRGIGPRDAGEEDEDEGVRGLGRRLPPLSVTSSISEDGREVEDEEEEDDEGDNLCGSKSTSISAASTPNRTPTLSLRSRKRSPPPALSSYGPPTNLLGQTCVAWLCRWGADILPYEESAASPIVSQLPPSIPLWGKGGLPAAWVRVVLSSDECWVREEMFRWDLCRRVVDLRRDGWAREKGRDAALEKEEEMEWEKLFAEGVYYTHMGFEDLIRISQTLSPHTGKPYTPLRVLHRAHWANALLRTAVLAAPSSPSPETATIPGLLGLLRTTDEILEAADASKGAEDEQAWYGVPPDDAQRVGDLSPASIASLTAASPVTGKGRRAFDEKAWFGVGQQRRSAREILAGNEAGGSGWTQFEPYRFSVEFFSASSLRVDKAKVPKIHSRTIFYAGSLFNVYIQVVRKKKDDKAPATPGAPPGDKEATQLGVYVQRWSMVEPLPPASAPPHSRSPLVAAGHRRGESGASAHSMTSPTSAVAGPSTLVSHSSPTTPSGIGIGIGPAAIPMPRSMTPSSLPRHLSHPHHPPTGTSSLSRSASPPSPSLSPVPTPSLFTLSPPPLPITTLPPTPPPIPYRDPRQTLRAYFTVSCCSALGGSLTRFSSAPDKFDVGQSWGWKSSCLREGEAGEAEGGGGGLRVSVVIGLV